jgi:hypothetical protein
LQHDCEFNSTDKIGKSWYYDFRYGCTCSGMRFVGRVLWYHCSGMLELWEIIQHSNCIACYPMSGCRRQPHACKMTATAENQHDERICSETCTTARSPCNGDSLTAIDVVPFTFPCLVLTSVPFAWTALLPSPTTPSTTTLDTRTRPTSVALLPQSVCRRSGLPRKSAMATLSSQLECIAHGVCCVLLL